MERFQQRGCQSSQRRGAEGRCQMIRGYKSKDIPAMIAIWNEVVEEGIAFPQEELLTSETGAEFFASQTYCGVSEVDGRIVGLYILHPAISATPAMPSAQPAVAFTSASSWCWIA